MHNVMKGHAEINGADNQPKFGNSFFGSSKTAGTPGFIQPKLTINDPNDEYEKEADEMADKVMRMQRPFVQTKPLPINSIHRKCAHCEEDKTAQRKEMNGSEATVDHTLERYVGNLSGSGQSLSNEARNFYEPRFGYDFSNVKVHTDSVAAKSAQSINALAYTSGNNIVFNNGQYSPNTHGGKRLLGHELTHVMQQSTVQHAKQIQRQHATASPCITVAGPGHPTGTDFLFTNNSSTLTSAQRTSVESLAATWLGNGAEDEIFVDGFASTDGDPAANLTLSCNRAEAIKTELIANGVSSGKVTTRAHGESTEFSNTSLAPNRRAIVSSTAITHAGRLPCTNRTTIDIYVVSLPGSTRDARADIGFANGVFCQCGITFNLVGGESWQTDLLDRLAPLGVLNEYTSRGNPTVEEIEMLSHQPRSALHLYYVPSLSTGNNEAESFWTAAFPTVNNGVAVEDGARPCAVAHEIGHVLMNDGGHHGNVDNLMARGPVNTCAGELEATQCSRMP